jgi:GTPase SAR1 family protein
VQADEQDGGGVNQPAAATRRSAEPATLRAVRTTTVDPGQHRPPDLLAAVEKLRDQVLTLALNLEVTGVDQARQQRDGLIRQLDDYLLPRLRRMDAPLLTVIGGSTGAGKSTLTNSLIRREVSRSGVLRPTTRSPVLVHHPFDSGAFLSQRILPGLARVTSEGPEPAQPIDVNAPRVTALRLVPDERMSPGLALIDAPDIDSIVDTNRELAIQLLGAADLWLFVTTAARYADAVPWTMLRQAVDQGASVAVVLDRVPEDSMQEIRVHFATMLRDRGLASSPVFTIPETELVGGFLPQPVVAPLFEWLTKLARDHSSRGVVVRRTLGGIVTSLNTRVQQLAGAAEQQTAADSALRAELRDVFAVGRASVERELGDGTLLRGEVLGRWQELVGAGEFFRNVESAVGRVRERLSAVVTGAESPIDDLAEALRIGVAAMVEAHVQACMEQTTQRWRSTAAGAHLLQGRPDLDEPAGDFGGRLIRAVDEWRDSVLDLVQLEAQDRRAAGRSLPFGVEGTAVILMLVAVSQAAPRSAGPGVATGTAEVAERLLDAAFGAQGVRSLAATVHADLSERVMGLLDAERTRLENLLNAAGVHVRSAETLRAGVKAVEEAQ